MGCFPLYDTIEFAQESMTPNVPESQPWWLLALVSPTKGTHYILVCFRICAVMQSRMGAKGGQPRRRHRTLRGWFSLAPEVLVSIAIHTDPFHSSPQSALISEAFLSSCCGVVVFFSRPREREREVKGRRCRVHRPVPARPAGVQTCPVHDDGTAGTVGC